MKTRLLFSLFAAIALAPASTLAADEPAAQPEPNPTLAIIISEHLGRRTSQTEDFYRLESSFIRIAKERKWPVTLEVERFAANVPDYDTEVSLFLQPVRQELPGEYTFRAWTTLKVNGKKHDFGIVKFDYRPRPGEMTYDTLEKLHLGAARKIADKIEPVLFPKKEPSADGS